jgi:hypothetical protein
MNRYIEHLDREWAVMGWPTYAEDDPQAWIYSHLKKLLEAFDGEGHSGTSAPYIISLFSKLAAFEPIGPLTGNDDEWDEVGEGVLQNKRCSHVFKENGKAHDIEGCVFRRPDGSCFTSYDSRVPIQFPYTPTTEYVDVEAS